MLTQKRTYKFQIKLKINIIENGKSVKKMVKASKKTNYNKYSLDVHIIE